MAKYSSNWNLCEKSIKTIASIKLQWTFLGSALTGRFVSAFLSCLDQISWGACLGKTTAGTNTKLSSKTLLLHQLLLQLHQIFRGKKCFRETFPEKEKEASWWTSDLQDREPMNYPWKHYWFQSLAVKIHILIDYCFRVSFSKAASSAVRKNIICYLHVFNNLVIRALHTYICVYKLPQSNSSVLLSIDLWSPHIKVLPN